MQPTSKLRFVIRLEPVFPFNGHARKVRILQQWWEDAERSGEWRDVMTAPEGEV